MRRKTRVICVGSQHLGQRVTSRVAARVGGRPLHWYKPYLRSCCMDILPLAKSQVPLRSRASIDGRQRLAGQRRGTSFGRTGQLICISQRDFLLVNVQYRSGNYISANRRALAVSPDRRRVLLCVSMHRRTLKGKVWLGNGKARVRKRAICVPEYALGSSIYIYTDAREARCSHSKSL